MYRVAIMKKAGHYAADNWHGLVKDNRFKIEPLCTGCTTALDRLIKKPADLMLVDLCNQPDTGLELIRQLRIKGVKVDVIALVSKNNLRVMQRAFRLGVIDCVSESNNGQHMRQALDRFLSRARLMSTDDPLTQEIIDSMLQGTVQERNTLPKGVQETTLALVRKVFEHCPQSGLSCDDVSSAVGLSRITVQRYLSYLCDKGELLSKMNYDTGGRPSTIYCCKSQTDHQRMMTMRQIV